jgi:hypothetical protein
VWVSSTLRTAWIRQDPGRDVADGLARLGQRHGFSLDRPKL